MKINQCANNSFRVALLTSQYANVIDDEGKNFILSICLLIEEDAVQDALKINVDKR